MGLEWLSQTRVYWLLVIGLFVEFCFELYLCFRQHRVIKSAQLGNLSNEIRKYFPLTTFSRAREYALWTNKFNVTCICHRLVKLLAVLYYGGYYWAWKESRYILEYLQIWPDNWDEDIGRSIIFTIIELVFTQISQLPISIYNTFWLEEAFGFNNRTKLLYITDKVSCFLINVIIRCPCVAFAVWIAKVAGGLMLVLGLWSFTMIILVVLSYGYPVFIAPLYNDYTPLRAGALRTSIEELATRVGFPIVDIFVVDGTKRSGHSNAYYIGSFAKKKIVISDSLIQGYITHQNQTDDYTEKGLKDDEVVAVIAHELGHWYRLHTLKGIIIAQFEILLAFGTFALLHHHTPIYQAFGFPNGIKPIWPGFKIILWYLLLLVIQPLDTFMNQRTQGFEYEADNFAVEHGYGVHLKSAIIKMFEDNLAFPYRDSLYSACRDSHPSLLNRLHAIEEDISRNRHRTE